MGTTKRLSPVFAMVIIVTLAVALLPSASSAPSQNTLQATGDPCTSTDLDFVYGVLTLCTSKTIYRFAEAADITVSVTASQDIAFAFRSASVEIIYHGNTVFSNEQLCLIPEGCLVKSRETLSTMFFWTVRPPAGSYSIRGTVGWDFACTLEQPRCLPIVPPPAVSELAIAVRGGRA